MAAACSTGTRAVATVVGASWSLTVAGRSLVASDMAPASLRCQQLLTRAPGGAGVGGSDDRPSTVPAPGQCSLNYGRIPAVIREAFINCPAGGTLFRRRTDCLRA